MLVPLLICVVGLLLIAFGVREIRTPPDELWRRYERRLVAHGLIPMRTPENEQKASIHGPMCVALGGFMLITFGSIAIAMWLY